MRRALIVTWLLAISFLYLRTVKLDLPYRFAPDEHYFYLSAINIWKTGLQEQIYYPPLGAYIAAVAYKVMELSSPPSISIRDLGVLTFLSARLFSTFFALLGGCFLFLVGKKAHSFAAGWVLMALFMLDQQVFEFSHEIRADTAAYMFMGAAVYYALLALENPKNRQAVWLSSGMAVLAFLAKYSVAPIGVFPAYVWLCYLVPSVRKRWLIVGGMLTLGVLGILILRVVAEQYRYTFAQAGFSFIFNDQLFAWERLRDSLNTIPEYQSPVLMMSAVGVAVAAVGLCWRSMSNVQRQFYLLLAVMIVGTALVFTMTVARYRDLFTLPYGLLILWAISVGLLVEKITREPRLIFAVGLLFIVPGYLTLLDTSNFLRYGDSRVQLIQWVENHIAEKTYVYKEYETGTLLPHISGINAPYLPLSSDAAPTMTDLTAAEWWERGYVYVIADSRFDGGAWLHPEQDQTIYDGFTLAYQTPADWQGPGRRFAVFYTFAIQQQVDYQVGEAAQLFGYNLDAPCGDEPLTLRLYWRSLSGTQERDYLSFVRVHDEHEIITENTQPPMAEWFPATAWKKYDLLFDDHRLPVENDHFTVEVGLIDPVTGLALPVLDVNGKPIGDVIPLGEFEACN